jgi:hypothetical protein
LTIINNRSIIILIFGSARAGSASHLTLKLWAAKKKPANLAPLIRSAMEVRRVEKKVIQVVRGDEPMSACIIWPQTSTPLCRLIGFSIGGNGRQIRKQDVRAQEELTARNIDLEIEAGFEGHDCIIVAYWSAHRHSGDPVRVVAFSPGPDYVAICGSPGSELLVYFRRLRALLRQKEEWQEMIGSIQSDEHLVALRRSKESLVRLAGDKVMEKILELGIALGLDWQAELEKLRASRRSKK